MPYGQILADLITTSDGVSAAGLYGMKNRIINGDMRIDQRNAGASVTPGSGDFIVDRFKYLTTQISKFTAQQNQGSVTPPTGFVNYVGFTSSSAYSITSTDSFSVHHVIEGLNVADLAWGTASAAAITLSFWVRSSLTGTFGGALRNSGNTRSYPFTYSISSANTWTKISLTIAGDTSGTWLTTNGVGINILWGLGVGSTFSGTAGAWAGSNFNSATGATSVVGTNGATFYITGVQLEKGTTATSFDYRPYGTELALCQRYYYRQYSSATGSRFGMGQVLTSTSALVNSLFPVTMRTAPTALEQTGTAANYLITNNAGTGVACSAVPAFNIANVSEANTLFTVASGLTAGNACFCPASAANIYLGWSAEL